jgi:Nuclease-related domain
MVDLRRSKAAGTPAEGENADADEEAKQRTHTLLSALSERDWTVLADFDPRHGIDHVVVGPSGVFVIASRKPAGSGARVRDGVLWLRRGADAHSDKPGVGINRQALDAARALAREIRTRTGRGPTVNPVVVLWCEFPQRVTESSQIAFVQGRELRAWLTHRPQQLDEPGRTEIVRALRAMPRHEHRRLPHINVRRHVA